ncbi:hypothetical protein V5799_019363 [Amblyomma americanum]|uniref:Uncharacterized protein n=1 Tax=Amblyomma americanum TaxID=6943 RepID=A0AAQ4EWR4_AMBAM
MIKMKKVSNEPLCPSVNVLPSYGQAALRYRDYETGRTTYINRGRGIGRAPGLVGDPGLDVARIGWGTELVGAL